jgi:hypothetical protein
MAPCARQYTRHLSSGALAALFCVASPWRVRRSLHRLTQRRATMQMRLPFLDVPVPEDRVWDALEDDQRAVVIEVLARLLVKVAVAHTAPEGPG